MEASSNPPAFLFDLDGTLVDKRLPTRAGGYGQTELEQAGAYRVYQDPLDLLEHLDEVGIRTAQVELG